MQNLTRYLPKRNRSVLFLREQRASERGFALVSARRSRHDRITDSLLIRNGAEL
jgi:hypothetical protein